MSPEERDVRHAHLTWISAVNAGDLVRLLSLMTPDVVLLSPGQAPCGREGFSANFASATEQSLVACRSELDEVAVFGEMAYTRSRDALTVTRRSGGTETRLLGHRLTIYRREPDGRWLLARDAHTLSQVS